MARSTFPSQNVQSTPFSDHFWKLRCRKSARRCGAKHISKSKCTKHTILGPLLEVEMSKKCTPLWREAHFEVKMYKAPHVRATFGGSDPEKCTLLWREAHLEVKMYKTLYRGSDHFWRFRCRFASLRVITLHDTLHYTTVHYTTLHSTTLQLQLQNYTTTLHYTPLHYINYNTLRHITLHSTTLHHITLHYTLHYTTLHYTTLYTPHTTVHYTTLHSTTLQLQLQNYTTTLHYTPLHTATLNYVLPSASKNASSDALRDRIIWVRTSNFGEVCTKGSKSFFMCGTVARDLSCSPSNGFLHKCSIPWCCGGHRQK